MNFDDEYYDYALNAAYVTGGEVSQSNRNRRAGGRGGVKLSQTVGVSKKKSTRLVRNNEGLMLDGSLLPNVRVGAGGFDHKKEMTDTEIRFTGINRVIPTRRQRNSRQEKLVSANEIPKGSTHRQRVTVGGFVSEQTKQEIAVDFPHWVTLRDSYMLQLSDLANVVSKRNIDAAETGHRQQFLLLLLALRKVSIRIVSEYKFQAEMTIQTSEVEHKMAAKKIKAYLESMPTCLDFLACEPFESWIGVIPRLNPLLNVRCLDGTAAELSESGLANDLKFMNDDEFVDCNDASQILWGIHHERTHGKVEYRIMRDTLSPDSTRRNAVQYEGMKEDFSELRQRHQQDVINQLVPATNLGLLKSSQSRELKVFLTGTKFLRRSWKMWRKAYLIRVRIPVMDQQRAKAVVRKCFQELNKNVWQCVKYRALQKHYQQRISIITFDAWKEYLKWCRRFRKIYIKSKRRVLRLFFSVMRRFADEIYDVRRFRYNNAMRNKKNCFKGFKYNVILSKFELKKRLENMSSASFMERHSCQRCFSRWVERSRIVHQLDELEELVESRLLKAALIKWLLATKSTDSTEQKLSFADRLRKIRAESTIIGGLKALAFTPKVDVVGTAEQNLMSEEKELQAEIEQRRRLKEIDLKRKTRMKKAWEAWGDNSNKLYHNK